MKIHLNKTAKIALICVGSLVLIAGTIILIIILTFKKPDILGTDSIITFSDDGQMIGNTTIRLSNPNRYDIKIDSLHYSMKINGKTYLAGEKDSQIVLKSLRGSGFSLSYVVDSKAMDQDFIYQGSAVNDFLIDCYVSVLGIKKYHVTIPFSKRIAFLKKPAIIGNNNFIRIDQKGQAHVSLCLDIVNPNKYFLQLDSLNYSVAIEGQTYLSGEKLKKIAFDPLDTQKLTIPLLFKIKNFSKDFKGRDSARFGLKVSFLLSTPFLHQEHFTIVFNKKMPLVTDINIALNKIKINKFGFQNTYITASLTVGNPNALDIKINNLHYILRVDGLQWVDGKYIKTISLHKKSSQNLEIPMRLDTKKITKSGTDYLKGNKIQNYEIVADLNLIIAAPTPAIIKINIRNSGILNLPELLAKKK